MFAYSSLGRATYAHEPETSFATSQAASAKSKAQSNQVKLKWLEENLSRTLMICEALWEILRDEHGLSDDKIAEKIEEIDMRDGVLDGKNSRGITKCASCGRNVAARHKACIYCGKPVDKSVFAV